MKVNVWFFSEATVLTARFLSCSPNMLEIHDHRGCVLTVEGDGTIMLCSYTLEINQAVRDIISTSGLTGEELCQREILQPWKA